VIFKLAQLDMLLLCTTVALIAFGLGSQSVMMMMVDLLSRNWWICDIGSGAPFRGSHRQFHVAMA